MSTTVKSAELRSKLATRKTPKRNGEQEGTEGVLLLTTESSVLPLERRPSCDVMVEKLWRGFVWKMASRSSSV